MQVIQKAEPLIASSGLEYESYLAGIGRNLFYTVAASYLSIYLGVLFLLIANTTLGMKFLIQQRENKRRYLTLLMLGAEAQELCRSARKQINLFFVLVISLALVNSAVAIAVLFTKFTSLPTGVVLGKMVLLAGLGLFAFAGLEVFYIYQVKRSSSREILALDVSDRR